MEGPTDISNLEGHGGGRKDATGTSFSGASSAHEFFNREASVHQLLGGGKIADVLLWKQPYFSMVVILVATVAWLVLEHSGLSSLSLCSNVLLVLVVLSFVRANNAVNGNEQLEILPELELSEEMVNDAAAYVRVRFNHMLVIAHDITLGKDFKLVSEVVVFFWVLSVIGSLISFLTLVYIGTMVSMGLPAVYNEYRDLVHKYCWMIHHKFSKHYRIVDENVIRRLPRSFSKHKDI